MNKYIARKGHSQVPSPKVSAEPDFARSLIGQINSKRVAEERNTRGMTTDTTRISLDNVNDKMRKPGLG